MSNALQNVIGILLSQINYNDAIVDAGLKFINLNRANLSPNVTLDLLRVVLQRPYTVIKVNNLQMIIDILNSVIANNIDNIDFIIQPVTHVINQLIDFILFNKYNYAPDKLIPIIEQFKTIFDNYNDKLNIDTKRIDQVLIAMYILDMDFSQAYEIVNKYINNEDKNIVLAFAALGADAAIHENNTTKERYYNDILLNLF